MLKTVAKGLALVALLFFVAACTPMPKPDFAGEKSVAIVGLPIDGSIPSEWGDLVAVTVNPTFAYQYQLWFQDEQGNVRLVVFDNRSKQLLSEARLFPRSGGEPEEGGQGDE